MTTTKNTTKETPTDGPGLAFKKTAIPTVTYVSKRANPYLDIVGSIIGGNEAVEFDEPLEKGMTVLQAFNRYKTELQAAGKKYGYTVRSHVYDQKSGYKFVLPAAKDATLKLVGDGDEVDPNTVTVFHVVFWATEPIIRAGSTPEGVAQNGSEK